MKIYESKNYKALLIVPIIILLFSLYFSMQVKQGIDLRGGTLIQVTVPSGVNVEQFTEELLKEFELEDLKVRAIKGGTNGLYIEFLGEKNLLKAQEAIEKKEYDKAVSLCEKWADGLQVNTTDDKMMADAYFSKARQNFKNSLTSFISSKLGVSSSDFTIQEIGPSLGQSFLNQAKNAIIIAFVFITLMIFYYFRKPVVSLAVVQSAFFDVFVAYASLGLFGIPLSLATIAPLLMLVGYSVDTDIMLTDRLISRKKGTKYERIYSAMKTGLTMTATTLFALISIAIVSYYYSVSVMLSISIILIMGLLADLIATWFTNATLIMWYLERKNK